MLNSTLAYAHQHSVGAKGEPEAEAIGRSKSGLSTKLHTVVDALVKPAAFTVPLDKPATAMAHDVDERVLERLQAQGKTAVIPPKRNRKQRQANDEALSKERHLIEHFFAKLKPYRAVATRYSKWARNFLCAVYLAAVVWLN